MKKLNRKGFTLIELLAIIVILAIVMVVTIPTVLDSMTGAKRKQFDNAADSVAEWFQKQYELSTFEGGIADVKVNTLFSTNKEDIMASDLSDPFILTEQLLTAAGFANSKQELESEESTIYYNTVNGRFCVELVGKVDGTGSFGKMTASSSGC